MKVTACVLGLATGVAAFGAPAVDALTASRAAFFASADSSVTVRKNWMDTTAEERKNFVSALWACRDIPSAYDPMYNAYDYFPYNHQLWAGNKTHFAPGFGPWHRVFVRQFELELQRCSGNPKVFVPYIDFWDMDDIADLTADKFLGGVGDPTDMYKVKGSMMEGFPAPEKTTLFSGGEAMMDLTMLVRNVDHVNVGPHFMDSYLIPTLEEAKALLLIPQFDCGTMDKAADRKCSFRNNIEGNPHWNDDTYDYGPDIMSNPPYPWHGAFHTYIGGNMDSLASPCDPVFFLLHCAVDRMWYSWEQVNGDSTHPDPDSRIPGTTQYGDSMTLQAMKMSPRSTWNLPGVMGFVYNDVLDVDGNNNKKPVNAGPAIAM